jgi:hypothetical protein
MTTYNVTVRVAELVEARNEFSAVRRLVRDLQEQGYTVLPDERFAEPARLDRDQDL